MEVVMTLNMSVTDDQLGQYTRRVAAIAERLGKSLTYEKVMESLQRIHDGEFDSSGQAPVAMKPKSNLLERIGTIAGRVNRGKVCCQGEVCS